MLASRADMCLGGSALTKMWQWAIRVACARRNAGILLKNEKATQPEGVVFPLVVMGCFSMDSFWVRSNRRGLHSVGGGAFKSPP